MTANPSSSHQLISVDLGRTSTKACISRNVEQVALIPSNVAQRNPDEIRRGNFESFRAPADPLLDIWLEYRGHGYAIGQLAADYGEGFGVGQSKVDNALVKILACVGYYGIKGDLDVVIGIPYLMQEQFEEEKDALMRQVRGSHAMSYRGEGSVIHIHDILVVPEGYGSLIWFEGQVDKLAEQSISNLSAAVVDIGHQTTDFLMVDRFRFARGLSRSEDFGMNLFYEEVAKKVEGANSQSQTLIEAVNKPEGERFYRARGVLVPTDLDVILPPLRTSFARELSERLLKWLPERATDVLITGGGGAFFWPDLQPLLKEARLKAHLAQPSRTANALGQYIYGQVQFAAAGQ